MSSNEKVIVLEDNFAEVLDACTGQDLLRAITAGGFVVEGYAKINAGSGRPGLNIQTGALVNSIQTTDGVVISPTQVWISVGTNMVYARIHEIGGTIVPVNAKMLSWEGEGGERIFAGAVHIPARPYLRPAMDENEGKITLAVGANLRAGLDKVT